jgi:hypothetical protein
MSMSGSYPSEEAMEWIGHIKIFGMDVGMSEAS